MQNNSQLLLDPDRIIEQTPLPNYRPCAAIVVCNKDGLVLVGRRAGCFDHPYQFPQGGIECHESPRDSCRRELTEETGIDSNETIIIGCMPQWLSYEIPSDRPNPQKKLGNGQVQAWFLLSWPDGHERDLAEVISGATDNEFDKLQWKTVSESLAEIIEFKRLVYQAALGHFKAGLMRDVPSWSELPT